MIQIRPALETDVEAIRGIFQAVYGQDYAYPQFYEPHSLKKMIFSDETALLVAEDTETHEVLGTASVLLDIGAHADLVAEFGRLAVHPKGRGKGTGQALMTARIKEVEDRLHVGLVENRCAHEFSQRISYRHGFRPVGLMPQKLLLTKRETVTLYVRHFGQALELRRNHPRLIPEVHRLADLALKNCDIPCDAIVEADTPAYPHEDEFELEEMASELYPALLRLERGRVRSREIFGPVRLHYGLFQLRANRGQYLLARRNGTLIGAVGYAIDRLEKTARVFELVSLDDTPIHFLLEKLVSCCRDQHEIDYLEADVSAFSPQMQRTLLEVGFLPVAYIPAMVFHDVERLDIVRMARLFAPWDDSELQLFEATRPIADVVGESFRVRNVIPRLTEATNEVPLCEGLTVEQKRWLAAVATLESFTKDQIFFGANDPEDAAWILLSGEVDVRNSQGDSLGIIGQGECLGEMMIVRNYTHTLSAVARTEGEAMRVGREALVDLIRKRPDIGVVLNRNLCKELARKLHRMNQNTFPFTPNICD
ncbi:MAG: GNAT family N-acetyltransferase [Planctomycetaceae bacterium]|nr:GNAT family N-acetyltransferase [Planctomycetaceae bacterium]